MRLQVDVQQGLLGINTKSHTFSMSSKLPTMELSPTKPAVQINITYPKVKIDQKEQFDQMGKQTPLSMTRTYAQKGSSISLSGIARRADEGRMLADIHKPVVIGDLTANREQYPRKRQLTIDAIPKTPPKIDFHIKEPEISFTEGKINGKPNYGKVSVDSQMGQVSLFWLQKPDVQITYLGSSVDFLI